MQDMTVGTLDLAHIQQLENDNQPPLYAKREIALIRGEGAYLFRLGRPPVYSTP